MPNPVRSLWVRSLPGQFSVRDLCFAGLDSVLARADNPRHVPRGSSFHHVGLVVHDIDATCATLQSLGYRRASPRYHDDRQGILILFLESPGAEAPRLELVQPDKPDSVVRNLLTKSGAGPYHLCFEVDDLQETIDHMSEAGYRPLDEPYPSPAFENRRFVFLYHRECGLVEVVEAPGA